MDTIDIIIRFLEAAALGALVGIEREVVGNKKSSDENGHRGFFGGLRSYTLMSLLGAVSVLLGNILGDMKIVLIFTGTIAMVLILLSYTYSAFQRHQFGTTSELAAMMVFLLGALLMLGEIQIAIFLGIFTAIILNFKSRIDPFLHTIREEEITTTLKFVAIALIILPLLPNTKYSLHDMLIFLPETDFTQIDFFNPYSIWLFVVIMSAVSYVGYILTKIFGSRKGIIFSGALGGLVSSTAVTSSMAEKSTQNESTYLYPTVIATTVACSIMLIRVFGIVLIFNPLLLTTLSIPLIAMIVTSIAILLWLWQKNEKQSTVVLMNDFRESPFQISPALKFAGFVIVIKFLSIVALSYQEVIVNSTMFISNALPILSGVIAHLPTLVLAIFSGLADVDAITQQMAELSGETGKQMFPHFVASVAIILAIVTNTAVKMGIARKFGSPHFGKYISRILGVVLLVGVVLLAFFH